MSQGQPKRRQDEPIKYGDVFEVSGDLAKQPIVPKDAAIMQAAETTVLGQTQKSGPAAAMQAAATVNERAGFVGHDDVTDAVKQGGVTVAETKVPGSRSIITESVAGQVVEATTPKGQTTAGGNTQKTASTTIGEALEAAAAQSAGNKAVDHSDAAAIQAAECRATSCDLISPGGLAAAAQAAATYNEGLIGDGGKVKLRDILTGAAAKLGADNKAVTREDAEGILSAELRNDPEMKMHPGGVAESVAAAAKMNERATSA